MELYLCPYMHVYIYSTTLSPSVLCQYEKSGITYVPCNTCPGALPSNALTVFEFMTSSSTLDKRQKLDTKENLKHCAGGGKIEVYTAGKKKANNGPLIGYVPKTRRGRQ